MTDFSISTVVSIGSVRETEDHPLKMIAIFSCVGVIVSLGLMTFGIDFGAAWI